MKITCFVAPHIGHVYTSVLADATARFHRMLGYNPVIFCTGTDEHGFKIQKAAQGARKDPTAHCDEVSGVFRRVLEQCELSNTDFIRTTEQRHKDNVREFWVISSSLKLYRSVILFPSILFYREY